MRVLVTGGSGKVGSVVVAELLEHGHEVTVFDQHEPKDDRVELKQGDMLDLDVCREVVKGFEGVVHLAAIPTAGIAPPMVTLNTNVMGVANMLEACAEAGVRRFVFGSSESASGFGIRTKYLCPDYLPLDELHPSKPTESYGLSKLLGEQICASGTEAHGIETVCLRYTWVWFEPLQDQRPTVEQATGESETLGAYIVVYDVASACRLALETPGLTHEKFFLTAEDTFVRTRTQQIIERHYSGTKELRNIDGWLAKPYASMFDISKAKRVLGWEPAHSWRGLFPDLAGDVG